MPTMQACFTQSALVIDNIEIGERTWLLLHHVERRFGQMQRDGDAVERAAHHQRALECVVYKRCSGVRAD